MSTVYRLRQNWLSRFLFCFGASLLFLGAATCVTPPPKIAAVSLVLDRSTVPLGGPLELTIRFDVAPTFERLAEDFRVFVHFLDANDELMWADDHDPPIPTTDWVPGQLISYSRRSIIRMYPYIGEASIAVGLYSATTGERLVLAGKDLGERTYRVAALTLEPQPESAFLIYEDGWHQTESDLSGRQWRWTSELAGLAFRNPIGNTVLHLEVQGRPDLFDVPQKVEIMLGEQTLYELLLDSSHIRYKKIRLIAADLGTTPTVNLSIRVSQTFIPAELDESSMDTRRLGVSVSYVFLEPR